MKDYPLEFVAAAFLAIALVPLATAAEPFKTGDTVVFQKGATPLMVEKEVLAVLSEGAKGEVVSVRADWVAVRVEVRGKTLVGWVRPDRVALSTPVATGEAKPKTIEETRQRPDGTHRGEEAAAAATVSSLKIVSARLEQDSQSLSFPFSGSFRVYRLRLVMENTGESPLVLGDNCALFEMTRGGGTFEGVVQTRLSIWNGEPSPVERRLRYAVNNVQSVDDDGEGDPIAAGGDGATMLFSILLSGATDEGAAPIYGTLWPKERMVLRLNYKLGSVMKPEFLGNVLCVSPVIFDAGQGQAPLGAVFCEFANPDNAGQRNQDGTRWSLSQTSILPLDFAMLATRATDGRSPAAMRVLAMNLLADCHARRAIETVRSRLSTNTENSVSVRIAAIQILAMLEDRPSVPAIMKYLGEDQEEVVRRVAASALGKLQATEAIEALANCAKDKEKAVATEAVRALGQMNHQSALPWLEKLIADSEYPYSSNAVSALGNFGEAAVMPLVRALADKRIDVAKAAAATLGSILQPTALKELKGYNEKANAERARLLRDLNPALEAAAATRALEALEGAMRDPRIDVQASAVIAYGGVPGRRVSHSLLSMADAGEGRLVHVLEALSKRREPDAGPRIVKNLTAATSSDVCEAAIKAAVDLNLASATEPLLALLKQGPPTTRTASANALGDLKAESARDPLEAILADSREPSPLRWATLAALGKLPRGPREAVLLRVARAADDESRWTCLNELCKSRSEGARSAVQAAFSETRESDKWNRESLKKTWEKANQKVRKLRERLVSTSEDERWDALQEVKEAKDAAAIPALKQVLVVEASPRMLRALGDTFVALNCRDRDVIAEFLKKLDADNADVVRAAARSLRRLTGRTIGPYEDESAAEMAEDVETWRACAPNIVQ